MSIAIVGAGSWGTTLAFIASQNNEVLLHTRDKQRAMQMQETRRNTKYLPEIDLPESIRVTSDDREVESSSHVIFAVPSIGFRDSIEQFSFLDPTIPYISVTKGLEQQTNLRMSQVILDADRRRISSNTAVVGGPNLAHEIITGHPAATVVASESGELADSIQHALMTKLFRVYVSEDVIGCEIGGVSKNVVAIAVGIGDGFGYGDNAKATVMTRSLAEITRLGVAEGGDRSTFFGLAGLGDLIATCASALSRNRTVGYQLGSGKSLEQIQSESHDVAEGVFSAQALLYRARDLGIEMPVVEAVAKVIETGKVSRDVVEQLMTRPAAHE